MRQNVSITYLICEHAKLRRPRQKRTSRKIPTESQVTTFEYVDGLRARVADKTRKSR
ncbi:NinE family protein [Erwinia endophytica]|uniref:NinE family protein n=1 Tax=Erwinia endophytica TaxID=1563158 RepID=UPI001265F223|nr:NinE family protein [Erwinia endophytica]